MDSQSPGHDDGPDSLNWEPAVFSAANLLDSRAASQVREALSSAGVRVMPFGFGSALAVVSDVDGSRRERYFGYVGQLVDRLGVDFGDSTWLQWQIVNARGRGLGLFSPNMSMGRNEPKALFEGTRTFLESVGEHHKGNIDHLHAFYVNGPRVAVLRDFRQRDGDRIEFEVGACQMERPWHCVHFRIVGLCVVGKTGRPMRVRTVAVVENDGAVTDSYRSAAFAGPPGGRQHRLFTIAPSETSAVPRLDRARTIIVELEAPSGSDDIERLLISSTFGAYVLERLDFLRNQYNIEFCLITEHSGLHFRNPPRMQADDDRLKDHVRSVEGPLEAYHGALSDDAGDLIFSTDADHPYSLCRVFPEIAADLELRFIVPQAARGETGFDPLNLVTPSTTRAGGGVYWARRVLPRLDSPQPHAPADNTPKQADFTRRLTTVLAATERNEGLCWPIYSHLGALAGDQAPVSDPYFDSEPLLALQDRVFNMSGQVARPARLWFARASVLYDYALILRSVASHLSRSDANTISITSWFDPTLGKRLPRSKEQLYGLTLYVDDPALADIRLDGRRLETIVANDPDETGRSSVTVAECGIRHILFDQLDPVANAPAQAAIANGAWAWHGADAFGRAHGRLTVTDSGLKTERSPLVLAALTLPLHGWTASGAQLITLAMRRWGGAEVALIASTRTGGRFLLGEPSLADADVGEITATHGLGPAVESPDGWRKATIAFHDLAWKAGAAPGGPLPSHPLESLTILCLGAAGAAVDIGGVIFLRPRTVAPAQEDSPGFCLGGRLVSFDGGETVHAARRDPEGQPTRAVTIDQRGWFCFEKTAPGIYDVWAESGPTIASDRRGRLVEVGADTMTLVLDRHR